MEASDFWMINMNANVGASKQSCPVYEQYGSFFFFFLRNNVGVIIQYFWIYVHSSHIIIVISTY